MKLLLSLAFLSFFNFCAFSQFGNPKYDKAFADSLGADEYGMKSYILVILKTGSNTNPGKEVADSLFRGHLANIGRLASAGKLAVAGPLGKNDRSYRGIFILNEATALLSTDPAIKEKVFDVELYKWYGSAALPTYLKNHDRIQKQKM